jgi:serine/threonine protein phosphatase PrpC
MPELHSYGLTDPGSVRGNNEDEIHFDDDRGIYFVIDGMGGHAAGEKAAQIAKDHLRGRLERATGTPEQRLREAITLANEAIFEAAEANPQWRGMACVLTAALVETGEVTVGHVGDSRLYRLTRSRVEKITRDHSPVGELEDRGELAEVEAMKHPRRNEVYRDVGSDHRDSDQAGFIEIYKFHLERDEALLLCSDGLTDALASTEILKIVRENAGDRVAAVRRLMDRAIEDGKDNISVVLVEGPLFAEKLAEKFAENRPKTARPGVVTRPLARPIWPRVALGAALGFLAGAGTLWIVEHVFPWPTPPPQQPAATQGPRRLVVDASQPTSFASIGAALDEARPGDTVELAKGDYHEALRLKSGVTLHGGEAVLYPPPGGDPAVAITAEGAGRAVLEDLKIRAAPTADSSTADNRGGWDRGVRTQAGELVLRNVEVSGALGPGIEAFGDAAVTIEKSSIHDNAGPGILVRDTAFATITANRIANNGRDGDVQSPGIEISSLSPCRIAGNQIAGNGAPAGIWQRLAPTKELLEQNTFGPDERKGRKKDVRVTGAQ